MGFDDFCIEGCPEGFVVRPSGICEHEEFNEDVTFNYVTFIIIILVLISVPFVSYIIYRLYRKG